MRAVLTQMEEIEAYLMDALSKEHKKTFEAKLNEDSVLQKQLIFQRDLTVRLQHAGLKKEAQEAYRKYKLQKLLINLGIGLAIGAIITTIIFLAFSNNKNLESVADPVINEYSEKDELLVLTETLPDTTATVEDSTKLHISEANTESTANLERTFNAEYAENKVQMLEGNTVASTQNVTAERELLVGENQIEPSFSGGFQALSQFFQDHLTYPEKAKREGITGTVYVRFTVSESGAIVNPEISKGLSKELDAEAIRVVKLMPDWNPARVRGETVAVFYTLPINFEIERD